MKNETASVVGIIKLADAVAIYYYMVDENFNDKSEITIPEFRQHLDEFNCSTREEMKQYCLSLGQEVGIADPFAIMSRVDRTRPWQEHEVGMQLPAQRKNGQAHPFVILAAIAGIVFIVIFVVLAAASLGAR